MLTVEAADVAAKHGGDKLVLVASRRTDMPAFHLPELIEGLRRGLLHPQPMMQKMFRLRFDPGDIHSVGLWSQDFGAWLQQRAATDGLGYRFWYRFTILPDDAVTKPKAPPVARQLAQLEALAEQDGPQAVNLCVDPIATYSVDGGAGTQDNLLEADLDAIFRTAAGCGIERATTSVLDRYAKIERRAAKLGATFIFHDRDEPAEVHERTRLVDRLRAVADRHGVQVLTCCERALSESGLTEAAACVDGPRLDALFGPGASARRDAGQRKKHGCGCTRALDVGRYVNSGPWSHHCGHACPQCYARP